jgi:hypothetical protein
MFSLKADSLPRCGELTKWGQFRMFAGLALTYRIHILRVLNLRGS